MIRKTTSGACAFIALFLCFSCSTCLSAQTSAVPADMRAVFDASGFVARLRVPSMSSSEAEVRLSFSTKQRLVSLDWTYAIDGGEAKSVLAEESLSFEPTALCAQEGKGIHFYVGGLDPRTGHAVVERWSVQDIVFVSTLPPGGGPPITDVTYRIERDTLASIPNGPLIRELAYFLPAQRLLLFTEGSHEIWSIDPATGTLAFVSGEQQIPNLGLYKSFSATRIGQGSPAPGFIILGSPWRAWREGWASTQQADPGTRLILRDADEDGEFDEVGEITWQDVISRGYFEHEVVEYK